MLSFQFAFFARPESLSIIGDSGLVNKKRCQTGMTDKVFYKSYNQFAKIILEQIDVAFH